MTASAGKPRNGGELEPRSADAAASSRVHGADCQCTRCVGFQPDNDVGIATRLQPGHELTIKHGAYASPSRFGDRTDEIAAELWLLMPNKHPAFAPIVLATALAQARVEAGMAALSAASPADSGTLSNHVRLWLRSYVSNLRELGLTPMSAAELRLDMALGQSATDRLERYLEMKRTRERDTGHARNCGCETCVEWQDEWRRQHAEGAQ